MLTSGNISEGLHTGMEMYIMRSNFFLFASHTCFLTTGNGYSPSEFNYILRSEALCLLHEGKELKKPIKPKFIFVFIFVTLGGGSKKILLTYRVK